MQERVHWNYVSEINWRIVDSRSNENVVVVDQSENQPIGLFKINSRTVEFLYFFFFFFFQCS